MKSILLLLILLQNPADLYKSGTADMDANNWEQAAAKFKQVLESDPTHIPSEFNLAVCYTKLGKPEAAVPLYEKILEQNADIYEARFNLAVLLHEGGHETEADEQFQRAAGMHPQDPRPLLFHAEFLEKQGDTTGALEAYVHAASADPSDTDARKALEMFRRRSGTIYRTSGQFDKAIEILEPLGPENNEQLALAYFDKGDFVKAARMFTLLSSGAPSKTSYLFMLGKCQMELKQYTRAIATMQHVLELEPDDVDALRTLASGYQLVQDWSHAATTIERFVQLQPRDAYAYFVLATCYERLEKLKQALLNYNKFLELDDGSNDPRSFQARERAKTLERRLKP
jgi:tetratricopeptide (TPR) repeat protein